MRSPLFQLAWRFLTARKLRAILSGLSVAMGVGLLVALLTLNASMQTALDRQLDATFGTYELMVGYRKADTRLSPEDMTLIGKARGVTEAAGILIPYMSEYHKELKPGLNYYGVPDSPLGRQFMQVESGTFPKPGEVALSAAWAKQNGVALGDVIKLPVPPNGDVEVRVSGILAANKRLTIGIALFESGWLQRATGRPGSTFVLLDLAKGTDEQLLVSELQHDFKELEFSLRSNILSEVRRNMDALRPVALGMGIAALIASLFLLVASFRISLTERVRELGLLRAVAALPAQVRRLILTEGLILGVAGSLVGALAGVGAAVLASGAVARMLAVTPVPAAIPWSQVAVAALAGIVTTLLSALGVARTAARTSPLRAMRPDLATEERSAKQGGWFGIGLGLFGAALVGISFLVESEAGGLRLLLVSSGALAVALGLLLGAQRLLPLLLPVIALPVQGRPETALAARSILRHRRRSGMTVAAMGLGLILVLAIGTLSSSLVHRWYDQVRAEHPADIQLEVPGIYVRGVDGSLLKEVQAIPGITKAAAIGEGAHLILVGYDWSKADPEYMKAMDAFEVQHPDPNVRQRELLYASPADLSTLVEMGAYTLEEGSLAGWGEGALAIDLEMAKQLGLKVGETLQLNVTQGIPQEAVANPDVRPFTVRAIIQSGSWRMPRVVIAAPVPGAPSTLRAVYANAAPAALADARAKAKGLTGSLSYNIAEYSDAETATAELRANTNQRLALLIAVGLVMGAIAVMSLMNAIVSSVGERRKEFALLRAVGSTPEQVRNLILMEAGLLGLVGGIVGILGGTVLGTGALVGLEMQLANIELPWGLMGASLLVCLLLSLLAGLLPAQQFLRISPAEAMRLE